MRTLSKDDFRINLIAACADRDQFIPIDDLERFLDINFTEDSSLAEWGYREFADFADVLAENCGDLKRTCHEFDLTMDKKFSIKVYDIDYDIREEDVDEDMEIEYVRSLLPTELDLEIECDPDDLEDELVEAISNETGWLVNSYKYEVK